jgi:hypothetical protein
MLQILLRVVRSVVQTDDIYTVFRAKHNMRYVTVLGTKLGIE